ncbi:hypothetical protein D3C85_1946890 [compost metagenome]
MFVLAASPEIGIPSTIYNGSLVPDIEVVPRIFTDTLPPGWPELFVTDTPAARPCNN